MLPQHLGIPGLSTLRGFRVLHVLLWHQQGWGSAEGRHIPLLTTQQPCLPLGARHRAGGEQPPRNLGSWARGGQNLKKGSCRDVLCTGGSSPCQCHCCKGLEARPPPGLPSVLCSARPPWSCAALGGVRCPPQWAQKPHALLQNSGEAGILAANCPTDKAADTAVMDVLFFFFPSK